MRISILTVGAIASILTINSVIADTTVTSKQYVDTTRQATIPVAGTNANTPGETVVTYTDTAGTIGERGICNDPGEDDCNDGDLVTVNQLGEQIEGLGLQIEQATNLPTITTSKMTCVDSPDCTLWSVADQTVYGVCKGYGEYVSVVGDASECCSGFLNGVNTCGCKNNSDCPDGIECVQSQSGTYRYCNTGGGGK